MQNSPSNTAGSAGATSLSKPVEILGKAVAGALTGGNGNDERQLLLGGDNSSSADHNPGKVTVYCPKCCLNCCKSDSTCCQILGNVGNCLVNCFRPILDCVGKCLSG